MPFDVSVDTTAADGAVDIVAVAVDLFVAVVPVA